MAPSSSVEFFEFVEFIEFFEFVEFVEFFEFIEFALEFRLTLQTL